MFPLNNTVSLRSFNTTSLMENVHSLIIGSHVNLKSIIRSNYLDMRIILSLNVFNEILKTRSNFIFSSKDFYPSKTRLIIDNN